MSKHSVFNDKKCWSCEYYSCERNYDKGIFFSDSVETGSTGTCYCKKSNYYDKTVKETNWCSKFQQWGVIASSIAKKEAEKEIQRQKIENERIKQELQKEQNRIEEDRRKLLQEKFRLEREQQQQEYDNWYSSLSEEEKEKVNISIQEENKRREEQRKANQHKLEIQKKKVELTNEINVKNKELKHLKSFPIRYIIWKTIFSGLVFLVSDIPYLFFNLFKKSSISELEYWEGLGYDLTHKYVMEAIENVEFYTELASKVVWIPYTVTGIFITLMVVIFINKNKKNKQLINDLTEELNNLNKALNELQGE